MTLRLAIFLPSPSGGGAERAMIGIANYLAGQGVAVDLVLGRRDGPYRSTIAEAVRVIDLGSRRVRSMLGPLNSYIQRERPDVLLSALMAGDLVAVMGKLLFRWRTRLILSVQNHPEAQAGAAPRRLQRWWPLLIRLLYRRADQLVAISAGVAENLASLLRLGRNVIPVIYNPVVNPEFDRLVAQDGNHPWLAGPVPVIVCAGRLTRQKDYPTALKAFARVARERPVRLLIMGRGEDEAELKGLVAELGIASQVDFMGFVANPYAVMKMGQVFLLSSRWEGFANVVAEALACGTPVVSTDCPSGPAEILVNGKYGALVPIGDDAALASALMRTLDAEVDRDALRKRGREFSIENLAPRYLELVMKVQTQT